MQLSCRAAILSMPTVALFSLSLSCSSFSSQTRVATWSFGTSSHASNAPTTYSFTKWVSALPSWFPFTATIKPPVLSDSPPQLFWVFFVQWLPVDDKSWFCCRNERCATLLAILCLNCLIPNRLIPSGLAPLPAPPRSGKGAKILSKGHNGYRDYVPQPGLRAFVLWRP